MRKTQTILLDKPVNVRLPDGSFTLLPKGTKVRYEKEDRPHDVSSHTVHRFFCVHGGETVTHIEVCQYDFYPDWHPSHF